MSLIKDNREEELQLTQENEMTTSADLESGSSKVESKCHLKKKLKSVAETVLFLNKDEESKEYNRKRMRPFCAAILVILFLTVAIIFSVSPVYDFFKSISHTEE